MKFKLSAICILIIIAYGLSSCQEATAPEMNPAIATPTNMKLSISGNTVTSSWEFSSEKEIDYFVAELATDDGFENIIEHDTLQSDTLEMIYEDAVLSLQYYFRIRAVTPNRATSSEFAVQQLELPNLFQPVQDADISGTSAVVNWEAPSEGEVTRIELISKTGSSTTVELTQEQINNRSAALQNLMEGTEYDAVLYAGDLRVGLVTFTTIDTSAVITINGGGQLYKSLQRAIENASPGDVMSIRGEHDFSDAGAVRITKSLTIKGVEDPGNPPIITIPGFELSGEVPELNVSDIEIRGASEYAFNLTSGISTANVNIENSNISEFTVGLHNVASDVSSHSFSMDGCMVHDLAVGSPDGGRLFNLSGGELTNFDVSNSTFWNIGGRFITIAEAVSYTGSNSPSVTNITANNVSSEEFVNIDTDGFELHVNNSILTNKKDDEPGNVFLINVAGYAESVNTFGINYEAYLQYFSYWADSNTTTNITHEDPQYADAANGDFTVGNQTLIDARLGDPRWLPGE